MPDAQHGSQAVTPAAPSLADYQRQRGFTATLHTRDHASGAADILSAVRAARLRGRGGAGMLVADKWQITLAAVARRGGPPALVCNAYDADPRSLVAATLLTTQPFTVLEGVVLAAHALGVRDAYVYLRSTNGAGYTALNAALTQARDAELLGDLTVTLVGVDVGFMGGEESTMLEVIRGRRAMAQQRPPFPAQSGLNELPTAVNNVETLVAVVAIMNQDKAFAQPSATVTSGPKFVTVIDAAGVAKLVVVPFGTPIAAILQQAGVTLSPQTARGVVVGGPEGGVLPPDRWNTPFDFAPLKDAGTIVGSGTIEVLPVSTCMVAWARERSAALAKESCGKCIPCRTGVKRIAGTLEGILSDVGAAADLDLLNEFADYVPNGSLCGFGWNATHPLRTVLRAYPDDFQRHLKGECPTGTCVPVRSHRFVKKGVL